MSWTGDLLEGLATHLAALTVGTFDPDGDTGDIFVGPIPDVPDNAVGIDAYNLQADPAMADAVQPIQFLIRGDQTFVNDTADLIFDDLHGAVHRTFAGIVCPLIALHSDARLGLDARGLTLRAVNYDVTAMRPTASRND